LKKASLQMGDETAEKNQKKVKPPTGLMRNRRGGVGGKGERVWSSFYAKKNGFNSWEREESRTVKSCVLLLSTGMDKNHCHPANVPEGIASGVFAKKKQ